jgi:thiol-disulfide isomerase/thioredoxin
VRTTFPIVAGLVSGVVVAALVIVLLVVLAPEPALTSPGPTAPPATASLHPVTLATATATASANATAGASAGAGSSGAGLFHVGEVAPPLRVVAVGGGSIDLARLRGKPVWVNFMRTDCPPCRDEFPLMNGFAVRYASTNLVVVAVDVRESEAVAGDFALSLDATFPVGLDADGAAQTAWGAIVLPVHFWVDAQGIVRDGALGGIGPDIMARGLSTILPGVSVTP